MRRCFAGMIFLLALGFVPLSGETLRMAVFQLEPFMMEDPSGTGLTGVTVEYWRRWLAPKMGYDLVVLGPYPIKRVEKMLENGEVDMVSQLTKIPDREGRFLYPETPLTQIVSCIAVKPESPIKTVEKPDVFYGKRVGFIEAAYVPPFMIDPRITLELVSNEDYRQINLKKLFAGRLDALLDINYISFLYYLREYRYENMVRVILLPVDPVNVYTIFRKDDRGRRLAAKYDKANREGKKAGLFDQITDEFLSGTGTRP